jgi:hypothetical protein
MRVQSVRTAVEPRNPARDSLFGTACQVAFGKVHRIAETHHLAQKIGPMAEALQNARHLLAAGLAPPLVVDFGNVAGCVCVFDEADLCFRMSQGLR